MEGYDKKEGFEKHNRDEIYSNAVRAGKRTYFFDVKATKKNDYYLTITESKKRYDKEGNFTFEKHKIFLYKEDFDKFSDGLLEAIDFIKSSNLEKETDEETYADSEYHEPATVIEGFESESFTNIEFEDLTE
ncbi:DUF3276 family protein [Labilibaculum manganireducens]|uniref:DNA-binding protein n=1 Tax=Labilibaculum manganireducens TaxID=1940525 RepID=A0A2N3HZ43_9BACT|nr:DUF3276 family protein [Labilibaculum manganireducens]PKQ63339.1 DNA-binding protein [Labilibaculum manganireducens]